MGQARCCNPSRVLETSVPRRWREEWGLQIPRGEAGRWDSHRIQGPRCHFTGEELDLEVGAVPNLLGLGCTASFAVGSQAGLALGP